MPSMKHYWKRKNKLYQYNIFGKSMPRNRFEAILRTLQFYDVTKPVAAQKDKIVYVISHCIKNFKKTFSPSKRLSFDEALLRFKGRLTFRQYIPLKRK